MFCKIMFPFFNTSVRSNPAADMARYGPPTLDNGPLGKPFVHFSRPEALL